MAFLTLATSIRLYQIDKFKRKSENFAVVVSQQDFLKVKSELENITYQPVDGEELEDGSYRLTFRCPPEKIQNLLSLIGFRGSDN